jgi:hypothetical protein
MAQKAAPTTAFRYASAEPSVDNGKESVDRVQTAIEIEVKTLRGVLECHFVPIFNHKSVYL